VTPPPEGTAGAAAAAFELRVPTAGDARAWSALFDDDEIMRFITGGERQPLARYLEIAAEQPAVEERYGVCRYTVVVDGAVAGFAGISPWPRQWGPAGELEIGWRIGRAFQRRGLAVAAARETLERARRTGSPDPVAVIDRDNEASRRVAARLGMEPVEVWHEEGVTIDGWRLPRLARIGG